MTEIYKEQVVGKMAWRGSDFKSKSDIAINLSAKQVSALEEVLQRVAGIPIENITREQCGHPELDATLSATLDELMNGRGLVLVRGLPVEKHTVEESEKMFWIIGTHFGVAVSQNSFGMKMSRVQEERMADGSPATRGTKSRHELAMHSDECDVLGLMCVRPAASGGETQIVSVPSIHNEILRTRPDLLPILYKGFPHHRRGEQPDDQPVVSPYDVPVFTNVNGVISGVIVYGSIMAGLHVLGRTPTPQEIEAMDYVQELAIKLQFEIKWDAGEIMFCNNFAMFHARSDFINHDNPEKGRCILRHWIEAPVAYRRPFPKELHFVHNKDWGCGIDAVPGRDRKMARNEYLEMPPEVAKIIQEQQQRRKLAAAARPAQ
jgi:hypothetical protein